MDDTTLLRLDFNLLKLLKILGEEKNTKRAADRMFLSQPAVSKGLKKLRAYFDDELFVRQQYGVLPTPYCQDILDKLPRLFEVLGDVFDGHAQFSPTDYSGELSVAINTSIYRPLSRVFFEHLNQLAPKATLKLVNWGWSTEEDIKNGKIHCGINYYPLEISKTLAQKKLATVPFKICCHKDHPFVTSRRTLKDLAEQPIALLVMPDFVNKRNMIEDILIQHGFQPKVKLRADQLSICLNILKKSEAVMPVSDIFDFELSSNLTLVDLSEGDYTSGVGLIQPYRNSVTPVTRWLTSQVEQVFKRYHSTRNNQE
ncbi:LysR family transcriptional regulator [Shewanella youngdeokensis]|uniref:LysR family transcriptional regulator n=1 Tax=Shewanella youngdeokensis TaxID=2999068 RepID=A0ABZ0JVY6_9GAMM|nr:LysR family transcriptional regulator [Shewanella sp. DAU334]